MPPALKDIEDFKRGLEEVESLPSVPTVLIDLLHCLGDEASNTDQIATLIGQDAGLAARLLKLANSSWMGLRTQVTSIQRAVTLLGRTQVRQICLGNSVWATLKPLAAKSRFNLEGFELHSLVCAEVAQDLSKHAKGIEAEDVYAAALLHDIGKFLMLTFEGEAYGQAIAEANEHKRDLNDVELEIFGWSHSMLGGWFAEHWGLPATVQEAARWHHAPDQVADHPNGPLVGFVAVANSLLKVVKVGDSGNSIVQPVGGILPSLNLTPQHLQLVAEKLKG
ncbi:MAG: hypothetical protein GHCLOJNM_00296 [bacterium]|nr:hypothetical protein [bacterium]